MKVAELFSKVLNVADSAVMSNNPLSLQSCRWRSAGGARSRYKERHKDRRTDCEGGPILKQKTVDIRLAPEL